MKSPFKSKAKEEKAEKREPQEQLFTCYACGSKKVRLDFRYFEEIDKSSYHVQPAPQPKTSRWWKASTKQKKEKGKLVIYRYRCIHPMAGPCPGPMTRAPRRTPGQVPRRPTGSTSTPAADPPAPSPPSPRPHVPRPVTAYVPPNTLRIPLLRPLFDRNSPRVEGTASATAHAPQGYSQPRPSSRRQSQPEPRMTYRPGPLQPPSLSLSQQVESLGHSISGRPVMDTKLVGVPREVEPAKPATPSWYYPSVAPSTSEPAYTNTSVAERVKSAPPAAAGWSQQDEESWQDWMEIQANAVANMPIRAKNEAWKSSGWTGEHADRFRQTGPKEHALS